MYLKRQIEERLKGAIAQDSAVLITAPKRAGKSFLLQQVLTGYNHVSLSDLFARHLAESDPLLFFKTYQPPLVIEDIHYVPALMKHLEGKYILTGSQTKEVLGMKGSIIHLELYPLSWKEILTVDPYDQIQCAQQMIKGFYPELHLCHASYLSMYLEREIQAMRSVHDLRKFQQYLVALATHVGKILNQSEIAKKCNISQTTATDWLRLLEMSSIIYLHHPYTKNLQKRVIKAPKLFFVDTGLLCYLLYIRTPEQLVHSPFAEQIFKNMVIMEKVKEFAHQGCSGLIHYYKTNNGLEIDLLIDWGNFFNIYNIKYSRAPAAQSIHSLAYFKNKYTVKKAVLLNLHKEPVSLSNGISAEHWFDH